MEEDGGDLTPPVKRLDTASLLEVFPGLDALPDVDYSLLPDEALISTISAADQTVELSGAESVLERSMNSWVDMPTTCSDQVQLPALVTAKQEPAVDADGDICDVDAKPALADMSPAPAEQPPRVHGLRVSPFTANFGVPCLQVFAGDLQFGVSVAGGDDMTRSGAKQPRYVYTSELNKLYVDMMSAVPVDMTVSLRARLPPLFVRCMAVYRDSDWLSEPVDRCPAHRDPSHHTNRTLPADRVRHFVHVSSGSSPQYRTFGTVFARRSVLVPWPDGAHCATFIYKFTCMSTCTGGVARRRLALLFLLEDAEEHVYGRHMVELKVCKCPHRDARQDLSRIRQAAAHGGRRRRVQPTAATTPPAVRNGDCPPSPLSAGDVDGATDPPKYKNFEFSLTQREYSILSGVLEVLRRH